MRFFKPNQKFWTWLDKTHVNYQTVVDVGCGDGDLVREMRDKGIQTMGVDPSPIWLNREIPMDLLSCYSPLNIMQCLDLLKLPNMLFLVCRPCHSGFPDEMNHKRNKENGFFYIGLEHNIPLDFENPNLVLVESNVGDDGENIYKVS